MSLKVQKFCDTNYGLFLKEEITMCKTEVQEKERSIYHPPGYTHRRLGDKKQLY